MPCYSTGTVSNIGRIKWQPVVLTFSFSSKELKAQDPLAQVRSRLEDLDIKTIIPYAVGHTTHVVQNKRNTAKGLQALVNGKYIVQDSYIDAVVYAATPNDLENLESLSPLEADFDAAWPDPAGHLPPPGKEPVRRPAEAFAPNPNRSNIFEGYTFVFGDSGQFDSLKDPINNAHGKALHYPVENGVTTPEEIVRFMRNADGYKGLAADREGPGGVVLVRFRAKGSYEQWSIDLGNQVALMTDQRVIEQSEFLDAILGNDASPLCRPLPSLGPTQNAGDVGRPQRGQASPPLEPPEPLESSQPLEPSQRLGQSQPPEPLDSSQQHKPKPRSQRVRGFVSRMKAFDDGFDVDSIPAYTPEDNDLPPAVDEQLEQRPEQEATRLEEEEDAMSSLLPGATAMKRRRGETDQHKQSPVPVQATPRPKRQKLDVREAARRHREAEEDAERERREAEDASLKDTGVENLKDLAIVEEMEVPPRAPTGDDRWDERWNGRKNFKKFRRKGDGQPRHRIQTVIVPLEEVTRKEIGIGEHHWVTTGSPDSPHRQSGLASQEDTGPRSQSSRIEFQAPSTSVRRSQKRVRDVEDSDSEEELRFRFRRRR